MRQNYLNLPMRKFKIWILVNLICASGQAKARVGCFTNNKEI